MEHLIRGPVLTRGVYVLPYRLASGRWPMVAVSREGQVVAEAEYSNDISYAIAYRHLSALLDETDPEPVLRAI